LHGGPTVRKRLTV